MNPALKTRNPLPVEITMLALMLLMFLQLLTDLIEATYTFGLLGTSIPPEIVSVLFLLTPAFLLVFPGALAGKAGRSFTLVTGGLAIACRALSLPLDTRGRMLVAGLGIGLFLLFLPGLLWQYRGRRVGLQMGAGLAFASLAWIALRAAYYGSDLVSFQENFRTGWALVIMTGLAFFAWARIPLAPARDPLAEPHHRSGWLGVAGAGAGFAAAMALLYLGFSSPTVISRWTEASYPAITGILAASAAVFAGLWLARPRFHQRLTARFLEVWNGLFLIAVALALRAYSIAFPTDPSAYPLDAPPPGVLAFAMLALALLLHPVIFVDFALLAQALVDRSTTPRRLAVGVFALGLFLLLAAFSHVFTTVYDYIPVIGPWFRDQFWLVYTVIGAVMALAWLLLARGVRSAEDAPLPRQRMAVVYAALLALAAVALSAWLAARPPDPAPAQTLRVLTFNIQQGYADDGSKGYAGQLTLIRRLDPDIIGLQESDTARIAGGNSDVVRYFADQLNYHSYYGPSTVTGTFGIALLSRYPIENPRTFFMYSEGEQTAAIMAQVQPNDQVYNVLVTHLGNGGPLIQQQQVLEKITGLDNLIAMGDFNFRPSTEQYRLTNAMLEEAWQTAQTQTQEPPGQDLERKIDHIFVTPGTRVLNAVFIGKGPSDHPALFVEIAP